MKRSLIMSAALPLVLTACPSPTDDADDEAGEGISTLGDTTSADTTETATTLDDNDTFDSESTDTADTTETTGMDCGTVSIVPEYVPPNVMLVVDASGSMISNTWDHDQNMATPNVTRWNTLYGVVETVMNNFGGAMNAGLQRFPSSDACPNATPQSSNCYNADACLVNDTPEVEIAFDNAAAVIASIPGANADNVTVVGGTPAVAGFLSARDHVLAQPEGIPSYVLLITDGAANCVDGLPFPEFIETYDENLQLEVGNLFTTKVGIDILDALVGMGNDGSPYANAFEELNEVAVAGGFPKNMGMDPDKFFNTTNQQELLDAIQSILGEVTDCTIDLTMTPEGPPEPTQIPYVTFEVDGVEVPYVEDCDTENGWTWIVEGEIMTFCGSYCEDFKNGTATFDGTYGCPDAG